MRAAEDALSRANPRGERPVRDGAMEQLFRLGVGGPPESDARLRQDVTLDDAALSAMLRSLSFAGPALGEARLQTLEGEVRLAARRHGGAVWAREIRLAIARRSYSLSGNSTA
jgi:hypothetical protein